MQLIALLESTKVQWRKLKIFQLSQVCFSKSKIDDTFWTSTKNSLELMELSSLNKVSLIYVSSCCITRSVRDDSHWTSRENSLELMELSSINKVGLV